MPKESPQKSLNYFDSLIFQLKNDFPDLTFVPSNRFLYRPPSQIFYIPAEQHKEKSLTRPDLLLLHELGHKIINKNNYHSDVELLRIEAEAWAAARKLCEKYQISYDEDFAEDRIDSYRNWLHFNSSCPNCGLNGYQDNDGLYHCPLCGHHWHRKIRPH